MRLVNMHTTIPSGDPAGKLDLIPHWVMELIVDHLPEFMRFNLLNTVSKTTKLLMEDLASIKKVNSKKINKIVYLQALVQEIKLSEHDYYRIPQLTRFLSCACCFLLFTVPIAYFLIDGSIGVSRDLALMDHFSDLYNTFNASDKGIFLGCYPDRVSSYRQCHDDALTACLEIRSEEQCSILEEYGKTHNDLSYRTLEVWLSAAAVLSLALVLSLCHVLCAAEIRFRFKIKDLSMRTLPSDLKKRIEAEFHFFDKCRGPYSQVPDSLSTIVSEFDWLMSLLQCGFGKIRMRDSFAPMELACHPAILFQNVPDEDGLGEDKVTLEIYVASDDHAPLVGI